MAKVSGYAQCDEPLPDTQPEPPKKAKSPMTRYIDLFAGAGGLSLGFSMAGAVPVYAVENDKWAAQTYGHNNPGVPVDCRDIRDIPEFEIRKLRSLGVDMIIGGPPCQGFSHANSTKKDLNDPRNSLFQNFIEFAELIQPTICLLENVPGLLKTKLANGTPAIRAIEESFISIGYSTRYSVLKAHQFGVPQKRERLFIVAIRGDVESASFKWPEPTHGELMSEQPTLFARETGAKKPFVTLWEAIGDLPQIYAGETYSSKIYTSEPANDFQALMRRQEVRSLENHEPMRHTSRITERFEQIKVGQSEADVPNHLKPRRRGGGGEISQSTYDQNSRRQSPTEPCNAMVASSHTNFIHPYLNRNFTVREMMRIQSFPDWFVACGKRAVLSRKLSIRKGLFDDIYLDQRAQIGNAVPPLLSRQLSYACQEFLNGCNRKRNAS